MKKTGRLLLILFLLLSTIPLILVGCNKKEETTPPYTQLSDISGFAQVQQDGSLYFEWLSPYDEYKPLLVLFHGESSAEDKFTMNLAKSAYTDDLIVTGAGYKGKMYSDSQNKYYDIARFWTSASGYNVAIFHWERFADDDLNSIIAKIFSPYQSRYKKDGEYKNDVFSLPLYEVVFSAYADEMKRINISTKEIRFAGCGTGALLAEAVAAKACGSGEDDLIPSRVCLCDAPVCYDYVTFDTPYYSAEKKDGTVGLVQNMNNLLGSVGVTIEMYESKEVTSAFVSYAYPYAQGTREGVMEIIKPQVAYLEIAESYSSAPSFDVYKSQKRIALDWYLYSVIGSDDESVGMQSITETQDLAVNNRGKNDTLPILNERSISNVQPKNRGRNYGLSAWTPTVYVRALKGITFTQKSGAIQSGYDIHGREKYHYKEEYVLKKFSSENYQVADRDYSVLCGVVYYDKNENNWIDDGVKSRSGGTLMLTLIYQTDTDERVVLPDDPPFYITASSDGFFAVRFEDAKDEKEGIVLSKNEEGLTVFTGLCCKEKNLLATLNFVYTKGITNYYAKSVSGLYYSSLDGNSFNNNRADFLFTADTVHTIGIKNCLYTDVKK